MLPVERLAGYPVCCLSGRCADDGPCEYFQEETDPEEPGNNKD